MGLIGFIGLGTMGVPMAANLHWAGHEVLGYDLSPAACATAADAGIRVAGSLRQAVEGADAVVTMLPAGHHVREVLLGSDGVAAHAAGGTVVIDSSTIDVATTRQVHEVLAGNAMTFVDAPVSGGVAKARDGTLTFMVGGTRASFQAASPYLGAMGANLVHAGAAGAGQAAKICNNMLFGTTITAVAEAFTLAAELGLDADRLFEIVTTSSGDNWAIRNFCPWPGVVPGSAADDGYAARFAASLMSKDLSLAIDAAEHVGVSLPVSRRANEVFADFARVEGHLDASAVIRAIRRRT